MARYVTQTAFRFDQGTVDSLEELKSYYPDFSRNEIVRRLIKRAAKRERAKRPAQPKGR